jgi:hypothetical protein
MSLLDDVSIVVTPNGYKAGELFAVIPVPTEGAEGIDDSSFANDLDDWSKYGVTSATGGIATIGASANSGIFQNILTEGVRYIVTINAVSVNSTGTAEITDGNGNNLYTITETGIQTFTFTSAIASATLLIRGMLNALFSVSSVSVKEYTAADMDVTRATAATRVDESGVIAEVGVNVPRIDYEGGGCPHILAEPQRTNILFPSEVGATQTLTVTAVEQVFTFYGTGTVVLSGAHSETLVGTGATDRFELVFTPTAGSLTLTVTGTVRSWQLEVGSYPTSFIITSAGTVTRNKDQFSRDGIGSLINSTEGVLFVEMAALSDDTSIRLIGLNNGSDTDRVYFYFRNSSLSNPNRVRTEIISESSVQYGAYHNIPNSGSVLDFNKMAIKWKENDISVYINGDNVYSSTGTAAAPVGLNSLDFSTAAGSIPFFGKVKQLQVYKTALTDDTLALLTS